MKVAILGGDKRMLFCAKAFADDGNKVVLSGFDKLKSAGELRIEDPYSALKDADIAVLPVIPLRGEFLNAPFSKEPVRLLTVLKLVGEKPLFCGKSELLPDMLPNVFDYSAREDFLRENAVLTAEGALEAAMREYEGAVCGARALVLGFGRIGGALSKMLSALGAEVTVAARRDSVRAQIEKQGFRLTDFSFKEKYIYDLIFNTVPSLALDRETLARFEGDPIIFDLASSPGGVDFDCARERGLLALHLLSLPGKCAPLSAGRIIKDTIIKILEEL